MIESLLAIIAVVLMILAIGASFLPVIPGPALVWAIGLIFAVMTGFSRVTWLSVALMTALMILGSTTGWWMQALGMRQHGGSCLSIIGALAGGLLGTFLIPIPFVGTLIGLVGGALILEFAKAGEFRRALQTGSAAVSGYLQSILVEIGIGLLILAVFIFSLVL